MRCSRQTKLYSKVPSIPGREIYRETPFGHRAGAPIGGGSAEGDEVGHAAPGQKGVADVSHRPFEPSLLVAAHHRVVGMRQEDAEQHVLDPVALDRDARTGDRDAGDSPGIGVLKSTDGGLSWNMSNTGMGNVIVGRMLMHPNDPNLIYAATNNGIFRSSDAAASVSAGTR